MLNFYKNAWGLELSSAVWRVASLGVLSLVALAGCERTAPTASPSGAKEPMSSESALAPDAAVDSASALTPSGDSHPPQSTESRFRLLDATDQLGIDFTYRNGDEAGVLSIVESLGGGCGMLDLDQDGRLDLFFTGGGSFEKDRQLSGRPNGLMKNTGSGCQNIASQARVERSAFYTHGVAVGDYDADGFPDVAVTGYGGLSLYRNMGDGSFTLQPAMGGIANPGWSSSAAWGDINADGHLDLYVARYVNWSFDNNPVCYSLDNAHRDICPPKSFEPLDDLLFLSDGQGAFDQRSEQSGLRKDGKGLGVVAADFDNDRDLDIYVANDTTDNFLYLNSGSGRMEEVGLKHGAAVDERGLPNGSMGVSAYDFDRNGWQDIWVANYEREAFALYENQGDAHFVHLSRRAGVTALGGSYVGFGTELVDLDSDGSPEIVVANGHVIQHPAAAPRKQVPIVMSLTKSRFERQSFDSRHYLGQPHEGRGLAVGDLNSDSRPDLVVSHLNKPVTVLLNETLSKLRTLQVRLIGTRSNRDAIGARAVLTVDGSSQMQQVIGGGSYLSSSSRILSFTMPEAGDAAQLEIHWPLPGNTQTVELAATSSLITIVEPN